MSGAGECARICLDLGVYLLGVIAPADRAMVNGHLASCPRCRDELAGLAALPALLRKVPLAAVRYAPQPWGTELEASVSGVPPGTACQIWATTASGHHAAAGGWTVTRADPHAWYPASVPFPAATLDSFDVTAHGTVLVTISLHPVTRPTPGQARPRAGPARQPPQPRSRCRRPGSPASPHGAASRPAAANPAARAAEAHLPAAACARRRRSTARHRSEAAGAAGRTLPTLITERDGHSERLHMRRRAEYLLRQPRPPCSRDEYG